MNVVLIGFKATGKTTVGRALAQRLGRPFIDLDKALENRYTARTGRRLSFREIFKTIGSEAFRRLEAEVASDLLASDRLVIALGGGTPLISQALREQISRGWVIWLTGDPQVIYQRILHEGLPAFFDPRSPKASFEELWAEREPVYRALASYRADTTTGSPEEVVEDILAHLPGEIEKPKPAGNSAQQWYAVRTKSRHEYKVSHRLRGKDFHVFLPTIEVRSRRKDRKLFIVRPMFPGYLFVECELTKEAWLEIVKTPGVANILGYGGQPHPVPAEQVSSIQKVVEAGVHVRYHPYLNTGDRVRIVDGPLKGAEGIMVGVNERQQKLVISVDLLNRAIEVEIEGWAVARL